MSSRRIRAVLVGFGSANQAVLELGLTRPWLEVVGIVVRSAAHDGEPAADRVPGAPVALRCSTDLVGTLEATRPDVAIVATATHLADVLPVLASVAATGTPIVCTAEDLAFIRPEDSPEAARIVGLAAEHRIPIVATGANPGFVLDLWPLTLSALAWDVERLRARRVVDVSVFGPRVRASLGIDLTPEAFRAGIADGSVVGHAGFPESLRILATAMGRELDHVEVVSEPILADRPTTLPDGSVVQPGRTAGANQQATGWYRGERWLEIAMTLHIDPPAAGLAPTDAIELDGRHGLRVRVDPGCRALLSTAAMIVNGLPRAIAAPPGVHRPGDLPPIAPWLGDEPPAWVPLRGEGRTDGSPA
jgi:4-hydroxy-tetrahydrodipicolinate reductase